jgi:hypothetical protein
VIFALMTMASLPLLMCRHPCRHQDGVVALVTMVLLLLIRDGVVVLVVMVLLPSSNWRHCPPHNGLVVIIHVVALIICHQVGIIAVDVQASSPLL